MDTKERFENTLNNDVLLWEALGPDGIEDYYEKYSEISKHIALLILNRDDQHLGELLRKQAESYIMKIAENQDWYDDKGAWR